MTCPTPIFLASRTWSGCQKGTERLILTQYELLVLHQLEYFLHKSFSSALHPSPPGPRLPGATQEPAAYVLTIHTEGPPTPCSGSEARAFHAF